MPVDSLLIQPGPSIARPPHDASFRDSGLAGVRRGYVEKRSFLEEEEAVHGLSSGPRRVKLESVFVFGYHFV